MLRRLVLEWSLNETSKNLKNIKNLKDNKGIPAQTESTNINLFRTLALLKSLKAVEILSILRFDQEFAAIIKAETKGNRVNPEMILQSIFEVINGKLQLLESENENTFTYFLKGKLPSPSKETDSKKIMYPFLPFSFKDGKFIITLVGDNKQVKDLMDALEAMCFHYRVVSLTDAKFSSTSPISRLTQKQQNAIALAFRLGYFDTPRKVSVEQLAEKLGLASSTLAVHLRRAERRLLAEILNET
jgi:hypothetical protein